ncbi:MAG: hypothetical protein AB7T49_01535 [Oligoflexales bacterium]
MSSRSDLNKMVPQYVAFVPLRGGSKSIPLKNIKPLAGQPLAFWAIKAALGSPLISKVVVSTDSDAIRSEVQKIVSSKLQIISRSEVTATDTAPTEVAMLEFAETEEFENIILIQATSPLITSDDFTNAIKTFESKKLTSLLTVVRQKRFIWKVDKDIVQPVNYDYNNRPRRQEFDGFLIENGAFYISNKLAFLKSKNRLSGKIGAFEMSEDTYFEIDEQSDWIIAEGLLRRREELEQGKLS